MRIYDRFILLLAILFLGTTVILSLAGENRLDLYFSLYFLEYVALTLFFVLLSPRAKRLLHILVYILCPAFGAIFLWQAIQILGGTGL